MTHDLTLETGAESQPWRGVGSAGHPEYLREKPPSERPSAPSKAAPVPIHRGMTIAEGFAAIVGACVRHFHLNEPPVVERRNAEALHQVRVAMRRLRSAFSLFKPVTGGPQSAHFREALRRFTAELGEARNLDVFLERELDPGERVGLEEKRVASYDAIILTMKSHHFRQLMLELVSWSATGDWWQRADAQRRLKPFANRRIDRLWSSVSAARRLRRMGDEERHRLRIQAKKLRYAVEFMAALHSRRGKRQKRFGDAIEWLQDELGLLNDIVVARSLNGTGFPPTDARSSEEDERLHLREAKAALRRIRAIGPYWRA